jgi:hypothetical protein
MHDKDLISLERRKANYDAIYLENSADYTGAHNAVHRLT